MIGEEKPDLDDLEHFGVPGMRWGRRKGGQSSSKSGKMGGQAKPSRFSPNMRRAAGAAAVVAILALAGTTSISTRAISGPIAGRGAIGAKKVLELTGPVTLQAVKKGASGAYKISNF